MRYRWFSFPIAMTLLLLACQQGLPTAPTTTKKNRTALQKNEIVSPGLVSEPPAPEAVPPAVPPNPLPVAPPGIAPLPPPILSQGGAQLQGMLRAPATLVSNNGGNLVSNNGGNLISNNGGSLISNNGGSFAPGGAAYRLANTNAPLEQRPLSGVVVEALDAAGKPLLDDNGQPIRTTSDANGNFAFTQPLPPINIVLSAQIPGGKGVIQAIATKDSRKQMLQADLFSTLTSAYIVERFVASQADRQTVLDRLPGNVETETRQKAEATFRSLNTPLPTQLDQATAVATTETLRKGDKTFDQQMEDVRKLLIIAGQSNRGEGLQATQIGFASTKHLLQAPGGIIYFVDDVLWRVNQDGSAEKFLGGGQTPLADAAGKLGREVTIPHITALMLDAAGSPVVQLKSDILHLTPDGLVNKRLPAPAADAPSDGRLATLVGMSGADYIFVKRITFNGNPFSHVQVLRAQPGQAAALVATVGPSSASSDLVFMQQKGVGVHPDLGVLIAFVATGKLSEFRWVNLSNGAASTFQVPHKAYSGVKITRAGEVLYYAENGQVQMRRPGAMTDEALTLLKNIPDEVQLSADGAGVMVGEAGIVERVTPEGRVRIAGKDGSVTNADATAFSLINPVSQAVTTDGATWLYENEGERLLRLTPDGQIAPEPASNPEFWVDKNPEFLLGGLLQPGPAGSVYVQADEEEIQRIYQIKPREQGVPAPVYEAEGYRLKSFFAQSDGDLLGIEISIPKPDLSGKTIRKPDRLSRIKPNGASTTLYETPQVTENGNVRNEPSLEHCSLTATPDGDIWMLGQGRLARWQAEGGWQTIKTGPEFHAPQGKVSNGSNSIYLQGLAWGPDQALYYTGANSSGKSLQQVRRFEPVTGKDTVVAGVGSTNFNGSGFDDGMLNPACPIFTPRGDLQVIDYDARQVKRIPKERLPGASTP